MTKQSKLFKKLEQLGINKKKIRANIIFSIMFAIIAVFLLSFILSDVIELSKYTKDAQSCKVVLNKDIGRAAFNDSQDVIQIASTGESVRLHPSLRTGLLTRMSNYFPVGKEYDSVWFYYEGEKIVHLRYFFLIYFYPLISIIILLVISSSSIAVITFRRIKYSEKFKTEKLTNQKKNRIRHIILIAFLVFFIILVFFLDWRYLLVYQALLYTMAMVLIIVKCAHEDYYIP